MLSKDEKKEYKKIYAIGKRNKISVKRIPSNSNVLIDNHAFQLGTGWGLTTIKAKAKIQRKRF